MSGWQQALVFFATLVAAGLLGLFVARLILGSKRRARSGNSQFYAPYLPSIAAGAVNARPLAMTGTIKSKAHALDTLEGFLQKRQATAVSASTSPKASLLREVESNLATATAPWTGKPVAFQTGILDVDRAQLEHLPGDLDEQLTEAYTDMRLANTLVWLSTDIGRRSQDLDDSYLKLCSKIATRLESAVAALRRSGM